MFDDNFDSANNLKRVFDIYKTSGILDETVIVENIAFLALLWHFRDTELSQGKRGISLRATNLGKKTVRYHLMPEDINKSARELEDLLWNYQPPLGGGGRGSASLIPYSHFDLNGEKIYEVTFLLFEIFQYYGDIGKWFDEALIPYVNTVVRGGRYATPRHLTNFMTGLVNVNSQDTLADFACGTGGMLVTRGKVKRATGIEISPNMAHLAFTNLILNGQMEHDLYLGNAFDVASREERFRRSEFDVVVMNPPFGVKIDPYLIDEASREIGIPFGFKANSETLFAYMAYQKLKPGGRMAVLIPNSPLFSNNNGETFFREEMVSSGALQAIISLPRDTMQPISGGLHTNVFYAVKPDGKTPLTNGVWFYRPRYDGLTSGRNRHPDLKNNDLPLVQAACNVYGTSNSVQVEPLFEHEKLLGYQVKCGNDLNIKLQDLTNGIYYVEVRDAENIVELIYLKSGKVFRGQPKLEEITIELLREGELSGEYALVKEMDAMDDESLRYTLKINDITGDIRKGKKGKAKFGNVSDRKFYNAIACDSDGSPNQELFINLDFSKFEDNILAFKVVEADDYHAGDKLFVFSDEIKDYSLTSSSGEKVYLFPPHTTQDAIITYDMKNNVLEYSPFMSFRENYALQYKGNQLFKTNDEKRGITVDLNGNILGLFVSSSSISANKFLLQWETYWEKEPVLVTTRTSADILGDIKRNQDKFTSALDRLLSISEIQALASSELPPRLKMSEYPVENLKGVQQSIWKIVQTHTEQVNGYATPKPFQSDDIKEQLTEKVSVTDIQSTLELFERMGLIVAVSYEGAPYFRLPEERDWVAGEQA